jgi:hypothetical protein
VTPNQFARLKRLFEHALDQPVDDRRAWLEQECGDDPELLDEARALIDTYDTAGDFLERPARIDPADLNVFPPGAQVGSYRIIEEIGRGGMGVVYLAEDDRLGRKVALKSLPGDVAALPDFRERLRREARAAATISHPSVAVVYALEEFDDQLFVASEYVEGETLRSVIARGPIAPGLAYGIALDIASALAAAHDAGVTHRDLKPENVLIRHNGSVKVVDFGIAQVEGSASARLTRAGFPLGTPAYMAPEQLLGSIVDARADIYAWGIVVSEMLTGRHPLQRPSGAEAAEDPFGPMKTLISRCVQPDPTARPGARELLQTLESAAPDRETDSRLFPRVEARRRWWWEFHQGAAALAYSLMTVPAWYARELIGGTLGNAFFILTVAAVMVSAGLRLHFWFTSRFYSDELDWAHRRSSRWIRASDWVFAGTLVAGGILVEGEGSTLAVALPLMAVGVVVAFLLIEPVTRRDAFRRGGTAEGRAMPPPPGT